MKRVIDILGAGILTILLSPVLAVLAIWIKSTAKRKCCTGRNEVTPVRKGVPHLQIHTMVVGADKRASCDAEEDARITRGRASFEAPSG